MPFKTHPQSDFSVWKSRSWTMIRQRMMGKNGGDYSRITHDISKEEFFQWADSIESQWLEMQGRQERRSVDRIDDSKGYSADNIRLLSVKENLKLGQLKLAKSRRMTIEVKNLTSTDVMRFSSQAEAAKHIGCTQGEISRAITRGDRVRDWRVEKCL